MSPFREEVEHINKVRMNFFKKVGLFSVSLILFAFLFLTSSSFSFSEIPASEENEKNIPSLSLIGVMVSEDASSSIAILKNEENGKTIILTIGESIFDLKLIHVFENRIILKKDDKNFQIFLGRRNIHTVDEDIPKHLKEIGEVGRNEDFLENNQHIPKSTREFVRSELKKRVEREWPLIIKETRVVPNHIDGKISGFRIINLPKEGIISEIGINKNDVIKEVNGIELNDIATLYRLYSTLKVKNHFDVCIERNGKLFYQLYILK